jgi:hypothetical protein
LSSSYSRSIWEPDGGDSLCAPYPVISMPDCCCWFVYQIARPSASF